MPRYSKVPSSFRFSHQSPVCISVVYRACSIPELSYRPLFCVPSLLLQYSFVSAWCLRIRTGSFTSHISAKIATFTFLSVRKRCTFLNQPTSPLPVDISGPRGFLALSEQSAVLLLYFQLGHNHLRVRPSGSPFNSPACVAEGTCGLYRFCVCVCVCVCVYIYIYTHTHTHTHIHTYIYIYAISCG